MTYRNHVGSATARQRVGVDYSRAVEPSRQPPFPWLSMSTLDESLREAPAADGWRGEITRTLADQKRRASELLKSGRERFRTLEAELGLRMAELADELARQQSQAVDRSVEQDSREALLAERQDVLKKQRDELCRQHEKWEAGQQITEARQQEMLAEMNRRLSDLEIRRTETEEAEQRLQVRQVECARREKELAESLGNLDSRRDELAAQLEALTTEQAALAEARRLHEIEEKQLTHNLADLTQVKAHYEHEQEALAERERQTQKQRRAISKQLRARKAELVSELALLRAEAKSSSAGQELELQLRLSELQGKYERLKEDTAAQAQQRDELTEKLLVVGKELAACQAELRQSQTQAIQAQHRLRELEQQQTQFTARQELLTQERDRLAAQLKSVTSQSQAELQVAQRRLQEQAGELELSTGEIERLRIELEGARGRAEQQAYANGSQDASRDEELRQLQSKLEELNEKRRQQAAQAAEMQVAWDRERREHQQELAALRSHPVNKVDNAELARLKEENKRLEESLTEAELKAEQAAALGSSPANSQELNDLHRRLELATQDCRELKAKNTALQDQLSKAKAAPAAGNASLNGMDWEAQKQRLLAQLESDFDEKDEQQKADKLTVRAAIEATDQAIAAKDQELAEMGRDLAELRKLLENQSDNIGQFAVGASAFAGMLDKDELIRQERENLQKLQDSLREQLRKAEIDISMERAKVARDRAEFEEKLSAFEEQRARLAPSGEEGGSEKSKKPPRGRWLERLGLKPGDENGK